MRPPRLGQEWDRVLGLLLLPFLVASMQGPSEVIVTSGSNVNLSIPRHLLGSYTQLAWFFGSQQKIVECELSSPEPCTCYNSSLKDRVQLDAQDPAELRIYRVQKNDSNTYVLKVLQKSGKEKDWKIRLRVFDPVPEPVIDIEKTEEIEGNCYLNLSCVIPEDHQPVSYIWYSDAGPFPEELQRSVLEVTVTPQNCSALYTCQASNPVSSKNSTVYFTPPCTLARSSSVVWIARWLAVMVPTVLGLLLT